MVETGEGRIYGRYGEEDGRMHADRGGRSLISGYTKIIDRNLVDLLVLV